MFVFVDNLVSEKGRLRIILNAKNAYNEGIELMLCV